MAQKVDKSLSNAHIISGQGYVTKDELRKILLNLKVKMTEFELEVFEVMDIYRVGSSVTKQGAVLGRYVYSENGKPTVSQYYPLNSNIIQYPLVGELWIGFNYDGKRYYLSRISNDNININYTEFNKSAATANDLKSNTLLNILNPYDVRDNDDYRQGARFVDIEPDRAEISEGDTLVQGRFGNFIRLGSNQLGGEDDSPNIQIKNGSSNIFMTSNQSIDYPEPMSKFLSSDFTDSQFVVDSDRLVLNAKTDNIAITAMKDITIDSEEGNVLIQGKDIIELKPKGSKIINNIKAGGTILNATKEGIPFPELDMAGFLKQVMGIQQFLNAMTIGVPKLSNPATLPSGVKDIVKGLRGAKNFIEATINLEFLSQYLLETKTIQEIKDALPIPAGLGDIIGDVSNITPEQIKQLEDKVKDAKDKLNTAKDLQSQLSQVTNGQQALIVINNAGDSAKNIPGVQDIINRASESGDSEESWNNIKNQGIFENFENSISEYESTESNVNQVKSYKKLFDKYKKE